MVLDYGSMSSASMHAQNVGWVAQHEVAFTVPLERWRKENGKLVFKDWACVSPFIFVDDEMSLTTGREVYGWPKVAGPVDASVSLWASHPLAGSRVFSFSTQVFPHVYAGKSEQARVLLCDSGPRRNAAAAIADRPRPPERSGVREERPQLEQIYLKQVLALDPDTLAIRHRYAVGTYPDAIVFHAPGGAR